MGYYAIVNMSRLQNEKKKYIYMYEGNINRIVYVKESSFSATFHGCVDYIEIITGSDVCLLLLPLTFVPSGPTTYSDQFHIIARNDEADLCVVVSR